MSRHWIGRSIRGRGKALSALAVLLALSGCGLDEVEIPAELVGPAGLGLSIKLSANPDVLVADGTNRATIVATLWDQTGQAAPNRAIFFAITDESGNFADLGSLSAATVTTDGNGQARTVYTTPPRPDATADQSVLVVARPVGDDANAAIYRSVRIELRSAEPRLFPQVPGNAPPDCNFIVEPAVGPYKVNTSVLFQTTSSDSDGTIVRYEWDFGDGTKSDEPDEEHRFAKAGGYKVVHVVTDDDGGQDQCDATIDVVN
jgi:PKD repeat protein